MCKIKYKLLISLKKTKVTRFPPHIYDGAANCEVSVVGLMEKANFDFFLARFWTALGSF